MDETSVGLPSGVFLMLNTSPPCKWYFDPSPGMSPTHSRLPFHFLFLAHKTRALHWPSGLVLVSGSYLLALRW